jgi:DNA-binding CsgD family transcriptional regulator
MSNDDLISLRPMSDSMRRLAELSKQYQDAARRSATPVTVTDFFATRGVVIAKPVARTAEKARRRDSPMPVPEKKESEPNRAYARKAHPPLEIDLTVEMPPPSNSALLDRGVIDRAQGKVESLTGTEYRFLVFVGQNLRNSDIAKRELTSDSNVGAYLTKVYHKIGIDRIADHMEKRETAREIIRVFIHSRRT